MTTDNGALKPGKSTPAPKLPSKIENILRLLLRRFSLNRFDAEDHHDHCLHSTISALQNGYGIDVDRQREQVPCLHGREKTSVVRYSLNSDADNIKRARSVLNQMERTA
jgi:hypothetical protein